MPSRKAERIVQVLREEILSGRRAPGERLPTYDQLMEQLGVTRPTVAKVVRALCGEGLVSAAAPADRPRGLFVARGFPHRTRLLWVTSERPGSPEWTGLSGATLDLIERGETGMAGEVVALVGVDGRANNPAYQALCAAVERGSAAGLLLMSTPATCLLPVLERPNLPRVAIGGPLPHAALVTLDEDGLIDRACARLRARGPNSGGRVAVLSPHARHLERARERGARGVHVAPVGCDTITQLLFERADRPEAVFVADDRLLAPLLAGLARAAVRPGRHVRVLARCSWPAAGGTDDGVERVGFDVREVLSAAQACIDAQRAGDACAARMVAARFEDELPAAHPARPLARAA